MKVFIFIIIFSLLPFPLEARRIKTPQITYIIPFFGNGIIARQNQLGDIPIERIEQCIHNNKFKIIGEYWYFYDDKIEIKIKVITIDVDGRETKYWAGIVEEIKIKGTGRSK